MSEKPLQMDLFEPDMTATVEVTELYGPEPGGIFDFLGQDWQPTTIPTCWGDLRVMVDALVDYAGILERVIKEWGLDGYKAYRYELHAARCRKIAGKYAEAIGYDREAVLKKCKQFQSEAKDDIGGDAMDLALKYGAKGLSKNKEQPAAGAPAAATPQEHDQGVQLTLAGTGAPTERRTP